MKRKDLYDDTYAMNAESRGEPDVGLAVGIAYASLVFSAGVCLFAVVRVAWRLLR